MKNFLITVLDLGSSKISASMGKIENDEFDMVVTDIRMPVLDGIGLLKKMSEKKIDIYTIILSSYDEFEYAQEVIKEMLEEGYILTE